MARYSKHYLLLTFSLSETLILIQCLDTHSSMILIPFPDDDTRMRVECRINIKVLAREQVNNK